jgi:hypothetical protein
MQKWQKAMLRTKRVFRFMYDIVLQTLSYLSKNSLFNMGLYLKESEKLQDGGMFEA